MDYFPLNWNCIITYEVIYKEDAMERPSDTIACLIC